MASKYPGVLSAVIPAGLFLAYNLIKKRAAMPGTSTGLKRRLMQDAGIYTIGVLIVVGPWLCRNMMAEGNPFYPLAYSIFGADDWSQEMQAKWHAAHSATEHSIQKIPEHFAGVVLRNDWQSGFLFAFAVPSIFLIRRQPWTKAIWLQASWLLATWWIFTHRIDRFWIPLIPILSVLAASSWCISRAITWRASMISALLLCCLFNYAFCRTGLIGFHAGLMEMQAAKKKPIRSDMSVLNSTLPKNAKLLMVGEAEVFDAEFDVIYCTVFDDNIFELWTSEDSQPRVERSRRGLKPVDTIRDTLSENGITHVYVNWSEVLRYRLTYGFTDYVTPDRFARLQEMQILLAPNTMSYQKWNDLTKQEREEVLSWNGGDALLDDSKNLWTNIQLYRVIR